MEITKLVPSHQRSSWMLDSSTSMVLMICLMEQFNVIEKMVFSNLSFGRIQGISSHYYYRHLLIIFCYFICCHIIYFYFY